MITSRWLGSDAPLLVGLLANHDPAAEKYAEWTGRACRADGLRYELRRLDHPLQVEAALRDANDDPRVHGIIVYYPIFGTEETFSGQGHDDYLRDSVDHKCDVEGLCHTYRTNLFRNVRYMDPPRNLQKCLLPCTPLAVLKILAQCPGCYEEASGSMQGKVVTVINRSEVVGRPLAAMLANDGADVYSVDINSIYRFRSGGRLEKCTDDGTVTPETCVKQSSVVITGVPTKSYRLPTSWIQPNTIVINVASYKNVDEDELLHIPGVIYIPMVGKVTVAMLERNLVRLFENFHHPKAKLLQQQRELQQQQQQGAQQPWYAAIQVYTAVAVTALLAMQLLRK